jgi:hypothetical protein
MYEKIKIITGSDCLKLNAQLICNILFFAFLTEVTVPLSEEEYSNAPKSHDGSYIYFWRNVMYSTCFPPNCFSLLTDELHQTHKRGTLQGSTSTGDSAAPCGKGIN